MARVIVLFTFCCFLAAKAWAGEGLTLKECYDLALKRSESVAISAESIQETEGLMLQSLSTALPKVAFAYSQKWQDVKSNDTFGGSLPEAKFTLTQPLFTGFKEFAVIRASKHLGKQRAQELKRAKELLFTDVSDAFYLYLSYQEDLKALETTAKTLKERVDELSRRRDIGKSRPSEVASAHAKFLKTMALIDNGNAQKEALRQLVEYLIGQTFDHLIEDDAPRMMIPPEDLYQKVDARADVAAARENREVFKNNVTVARSLFWPSVSLSGNAYTKRPDTGEGNDWDVMLVVNVPIFNGFSDAGQVYQAKAQAREADLKLSQVRRKALLEIRQAYTRFGFALKRQEALALAKQASEENYKLQVDDFKNNLVNNLDVLQAIEDIQSSSRDLVNGQAETFRAYSALKVAVGEVY